MSGSGRGGPFHTTPAAIWPGLTLPGTAAYPGPAKTQTAWVGYAMLNFERCQLGAFLPDVCESFFQTPPIGSEGPV